MFVYIETSILDILNKLRKDDEVSETHLRTTNIP
jgi:hypothetical protein